VPRRATTAALLCGLLLGPVSAARAETVWATGAPIELRSGATLGHRVLGLVAPGERLELLSQGDGWMRVRTGAGKEGWVNGAHVNAVAPPMERVRELETEAARVEAELAGLSAEREKLRASSGELETRDAERTAELDRLLRENARLSAGERWTEWLTGAGILACGMVGGALLRGFLAGRRATRIRL
jgi:uncharacterized protein YgiM (DUF1202 family)